MITKQGIGEYTSRSNSISGAMQKPRSNKGKKAEGYGKGGKDAHGDLREKSNEFKNHAAEFTEEDKTPRIGNQKRALKNAINLNKEDAEALASAIQQLERAAAMTWKNERDRTGVRIDMKKIISTVAGVNDKPFNRPKKKDPEPIEVVAMFDISGSVSGYVPTAMALMTLMFAETRNNRMINFHPGLYRSRGRLIMPGVLDEVMANWDSAENYPRRRSYHYDSGGVVGALAKDIESVFRHEGIECPESDEMTEQIMLRGILEGNRRTIFMIIGDGALEDERLMDSIATEFDVMTVINISMETSRAQAHRKEKGYASHPVHFGEDLYIGKAMFDGEPESMAAQISRGVAATVEHVIDGRVTDQLAVSPAEMPEKFSVLNCTGGDY